MRICSDVEEEWVGKLRPGDVFELDGQTYMMVNMEPPGNQKGIPCVELVFGHFRFFADTQLVRPRRNATLRT